MIKVSLAILWFCFLLVALVFPEGSFALSFSIITFVFVGALVKTKSNVHMMFFVGYGTFLFLPAILNWYYLDVGFTLFLVSSLVSSFFLFMTRRTIVKEFAERGSSIRVVFLVFCTLSIFAAFFRLNIAPVMAFLIFLMSLSFANGNIKRNGFVFLCFLIVFFVYSFFFWSGYGRTVVVGWLLLAGLQFAYSIGLNINKYVFGLLPGFGATLLSGRSLLDLEFKGFEAALSDSAYGPYRLASSFIEHFERRSYDFAGFFDQVIFTLFVFVPRNIWPDKPYGFGFEYTRRHLDGYLVDSGHSIASTLIGDHIYYLGYLGVFTSLLMVGCVAFFVNLLYRIKGVDGHAVLLFSASMMVFVWGGMTSFTARVALPSIIFVILFTVFNRLVARKVKLVF